MKDVSQFRAAGVRQGLFGLGHCSYYYCCYLFFIFLVAFFFLHGHCSLSEVGTNLLLS